MRSHICMQVPTRRKSGRCTNTSELQRPLFLSRFQSQMAAARLQDLVQSSADGPQPREEEVVHVGVVAAIQRSKEEQRQEQQCGRTRT